MDSILICTRLLVNQKAYSTHCTRSTTRREIQLCDTLISFVNKANPEKI